MLTTRNAGALIHGGAGPDQATEDDPMPPAPPAMQRVRVERPFYYQGKPLAKDAEIDLPRTFAAEMIHSRKAVAVAPPEPPAPAPAPAPETKQDKPKGGKDAG